MDALAANRRRRRERLGYAGRWRAAAQRCGLFGLEVSRETGIPRHRVAALFSGAAMATDAERDRIDALLDVAEKKTASLCAGLGDDGDVA